MPIKLIPNLKNALEWGGTASLGGIGSLIVDSTSRYFFVQALGMSTATASFALGSLPFATATAVYHLTKTMISNLKFVKEHPKLSERVIVVISLAAGVATAAGLAYFLSIPLMITLLNSTTGAVVTIAVAYFLSKNPKEDKPAEVTPDSNDLRPLPLPPRNDKDNVPSHRAPVKPKPRVQVRNKECSRLLTLSELKEKLEKLHGGTSQQSLIQTKKQDPRADPPPPPPARDDENIDTTTSQESEKKGEGPPPPLPFRED